MKKGFTLVELLAVTVLLGLIMAVAYPTLFKIFDDKEDEIDSSKRQIIENAAINYVKLNINEYPYEEGTNTCLFLKTLVDENKIGIEVDESLNNRLIKVNMYNNKYNAKILDKNETCISNGNVYEVKECIEDLSTHRYNLIDKKTTYYIGNNLIKQVDIIEGKNIKDQTVFSNQINSYDSLNTILKNNSNFITTIDINQEYFKMYTEIIHPNELTLTNEEKIALENAPIFYNSGTIKTTCG